METTAIVNIELNGKPVRNELQELRKEALRMAESFIDAENSLDFSKSVESLLSLDNVLKKILKCENEIVDISNYCFTNNSNVFEYFTKIKNNFMSLFKSVDVESSAELLVKEFESVFNKTFNEIELPSLSFDDIIKLPNNNDYLLDEFYNELKFLLSDLNKSPNYIDLDKIKERYLAIYNEVKSLIADCSNPDYYKDKFNEIADAINKINSDLTSRWKGSFKDIRNNEFVSYYNNLRDILLSDFDSKEKQIKRYELLIGHLKNLLEILEKEGKKGGREWSRINLRITETEERIKIFNSRLEDKSNKEKLKSEKYISKEKAYSAKSSDELKVYSDYFDVENNLFQNSLALSSRLYQIKVDYLQKLLSLETKGTNDYYQLEIQLNKAVKEKEVSELKQLNKELYAWLYLYTQKGANQRRDAEFLVAKQLYDKKLLTEEEYQEARASIEKKYRDEVNSKTGTKAKNQDFDDAKDTYDKQMNALEDARKQGLILQEDYESRKYQIVWNYHNKVVELINGQGSEWATMVVTLVETWKAAFEDLGSSLSEKLKSIANIAAASFAIMNAGVKSYNDYANASRDIELAKLERNYDLQIKASGKNNKRIKNLEEQKQREIAKIKTKYNKKTMVIEMAQAIAQTALAAINAYASASKVSWILGPIAAAMATAAGAIQIASIQKSHQAQAMGYYEGGFTRRDPNNRREVGVVHSNEFVANHKAVANSELQPLFRLIDIAQKNNTVGSLTRDDVSRILFPNNSSSLLIGNNDTDDYAIILSYIANNTSIIENAINVIDSLRNELSKGIESYLVMDGERGFAKSWEHYNKLKNNPKR